MPCAKHLITAVKSGGATPPPCAPGDLHRRRCATANALAARSRRLQRRTISMEAQGPAARISNPPGIYDDARHEAGALVHARHHPPRPRRTCAVGTFRTTTSGSRPLGRPATTRNLAYTLNPTGCPGIRPGTSPPDHHAALGQQRRLKSQAVEDLLYIVGRRHQVGLAAGQGQKVYAERDVGDKSIGVTNRNNLTFRHARPWWIQDGTTDVGRSSHGSTLSHDSARDAYSVLALPWFMDSTGFGPGRRSPWPMEDDEPSSSRWWRCRGSGRHHHVEALEISPSGLWSEGTAVAVIACPS